MTSAIAAIVSIPDFSAIVAGSDSVSGQGPFIVAAAAGTGTVINPTLSVSPLEAEAKARSKALDAISTIAVSAVVSPREFVLYGDAGLLIQSNNAAAAAIGRLAFQPVYTSPVKPAVPAIDPTTNVARPRQRDPWV